MNCSNWEQEIASESESAGLEAHLKECERCRDFAREIDENRAALLSLETHPAALHAVRRRVLNEIQAKRRRRAWWAWSAAAAAACFAIVFAARVASWTNPAPPRVAPIVTHAVPSANPSVPRHAVMRRPRHARHEQAKSEPLVVKMLTDDPNVIIIWLVDKKGDSL